MRAVKDIIRGVREDRGMRQKDIAGILGVNQQYYSKYENGEYEIPSRHVITLCKYYNISADYILGIIDSEIPIGGIEYQNELKLTDKETIIGKFEKLNHKDKVAVSKYIDLIKAKKSNDLISKNKKFKIEMIKY